MRRSPVLTRHLQPPLQLFVKINLTTMSTRYRWFVRILIYTNRNCNVASEIIHICPKLHMFSCIHVKKLYTQSHLNVCMCMCTNPIWAQESLRNELTLQQNLVQQLKQQLKVIRRAAHSDAMCKWNENTHPTINSNPLQTCTQSPKP